MSRQLPLGDLGRIAAGQRAYVIDASSILQLEHAHIVLPHQPPPPPEFTAEERAKVWRGLHGIAQQRRVRIIRYVREEMERLRPHLLPKIDGLPNTACKITNAMRRSYQDLIARYPDLVKYNDPAHDDADPWLIAVSIVLGTVVVTEEKSSSQRARKMKRGIPIPDVCREEHVECICIRDLAQKEGWL